MSRANRPAERYLTTVLMTDIVGSTEHAAELGDRGWRDLVQVHHAKVRAALRRHGGREVDTAGDGFFATFDAPAAAVDCGLDIAERVRELGIDIRAGVHVGEVEQIAGKVGGITVPIAARIMAGTRPGEVLVSATVRDLAAGADLRFEDRGTRELKGIPGEWRIFAASRADEAPQATPVRDAVQRRAAAVRSARSRPIWQRRPRLIGAAAITALAAVIAVGLLLWRPWQTPALAAIGENAIGVIDGERRQIVASIPVGAGPGGIATDGGIAWVAVTGENTVARLDLGTRQVTRIIDVGSQPTGLTIAGGSVWVANSGARTVSRINVETARVVDEIDVGNRPIAVAAGAGGLWVAVAGDGTVVRLDQSTGEPGKPIPVGSGPVAIAADDAGVWVACADDATVTNIDPASGATAAAPIPLAGRPRAVTIGSNGVWVAAEDGTITRIDPATKRITQTVDVGGLPASIVEDAGLLWVGDRNGAVVRVDPAAPAGAASSRVATTAAPEALASTGRELVVASRGGQASHRGGTLRVAFPFLPSDDPIEDPLFLSPYNAAYFQADGLLGYRRVGGAAGNELLPALAEAIPRAADGGRTWTFRLRPDLVYPDGRPVLASDFRRAFERSFQVAIPPFGDILGPFLWHALDGASACAPTEGQPVEHCDLSAAVEVDDVSRSVTFRLAQPDGDFLAKLALPPAFPVADGVPVRETISGAFPGTGPYTLAAASESELRFARNPRFRVWDPRVRPDAVPDEIHMMFLDEDATPEERVALVIDGEADYTPLRGPGALPPDLFVDVSRQHPGLVHPGPALMTYVSIDRTRPPFDDADVRRALSLAVDRGRLVEAQGGAPALTVTCQVLPPGWPGHRPYCPWTAKPDAGGRWKAPDLEAARALVEASGTSGATIRVGPVRARHLGVQDQVVAALEALGYSVEAAEPIPDQEFWEAVESGDVVLTVFDWIQLTLTPSTFFDEFACEDDGPDGPCDETLAAQIDEAMVLQTTDPAAARTAWAEADRAVVDAAYWVALYNSGSDLVSRRVGNVQFHPAYFVLLDQLWVQ